ncbi:MAG: CBS domain-containing protein [Elusimicrobia bacterium]|nr:CBS domain-containing protein [Elusimicrobiota bacterium]
MKAKDVMSKKVVTVERWLILPEVAKIFEDKVISGAPVVDEEGTVLGVVSQTDLVRARRGASEGVPLYYQELDNSARSFGFHLEEMDKTRVEEIMTPGAITLDCETPVETVAKVMLESRIHRILITKGDKLAGIVTSMDLVRALIALAKKPRRIRAKTQARPSSTATR